MDIRLTKLKEANERQAAKIERLQARILELEAMAQSEPAPTVEARPAEKFDRLAYQREYMRVWRKKQLDTSKGV